MYMYIYLCVCVCETYQITDCSLFLINVYFPTKISLQKLLG